MRFASCVYLQCIFRILTLFFINTTKYLYMCNKNLNKWEILNILGNNNELSDFNTEIDEDDGENCCPLHIVVRLFENL